LVARTVAHAAGIAGSLPIASQAGGAMGDSEPAVPPAPVVPAAPPLPPLPAVPADPPVPVVPAALPPAPPPQVQPPAPVG